MLRTHLLQDQSACGAVATPLSPLPPGRWIQHSSEGRDKAQAKHPQPAAPKQTGPRVARGPEEMAGDLKLNPRVAATLQPTTAPCEPPQDCSPVGEPALRSRSGEHAERAARQANTKTPAQLSPLSPLLQNCRQHIQPWLRETRRLQLAGSGPKPPGCSSHPGTRLAPNRALCKVAVSPFFDCFPPPTHPHS